MLVRFTLKISTLGRFWHLITSLDFGFHLQLHEERSDLITSCSLPCTSSLSTSIPVAQFANYFSVLVLSEKKYILRMVLDRSQSLF